jgi:hypothetical protein
MTQYAMTRYAMTRYAMTRYAMTRYAMKMRFQHVRATLNRGFMSFAAGLERAAVRHSEPGGTSAH